jgi:anti-anti-sigma factor
LSQCVIVSMCNCHTGPVSGSDPGEFVAEGIRFEITRNPDCAVVAVTGELDISSAPALRDAINEVAGSARSLVVDLDAVGFMDSSGLNTLIAAVRQFEPGLLCVVAAQANIRRIFSITGTDKVIPVFDSVDTARTSLG